MPLISKYLNLNTFPYTEYINFNNSNIIPEIFFDIDGIITDGGLMQNIKVVVVPFIIFENGLHA